MIKPINWRARIAIMMFFIYGFGLGLLSLASVFVHAVMAGLRDRNGGGPSGLSPLIELLLFFVFLTMSASGKKSPLEPAIAAWAAAFSLFWPALVVCCCEWKRRGTPYRPTKFQEAQDPTEPEHH